MKKSVIILLTAIYSSVTSFGQVNTVEELKNANLNWQNKDLKTDLTAGVSVRKAYLEFLKKKEAKKKVVVAVIDSGVDIEHEDLVGKIWTNKGEIPNNNIDDDKNGYVDDVHGWSFLGSSTGENINEENLEYTRIVKKGDVNHPLYKSAKLKYDSEIKKKSTALEGIEKTEKEVSDARKTIMEATEIEALSISDLEKITSTDEKVLKAKENLSKRYARGFSDKGLAGYKTYIKNYLDVYLNVDFNPRKVVGDDPYDINDTKYGNPDVRGPAATHGTFVAGIIAGVRNNNVGIDGIAQNVEIMALRAVPDGDERDKDVALAIIYAVDNGADIINMSFGKTFSPNKNFVDKAVKYADEKGVLLVHAAGNEGMDIDVSIKYPNNYYTDGTAVTNWMNIGANSADRGKELVAIFSNYGKQNVDLFAPGVQVVSLDTGSTYGKMNGTSFSCPVVAGVAALVLSYYPNLTAVELKEILKETAVMVKKPCKVYVPGRTAEKRKKIKFKKLSATGGIVNAYEALVEAEKRSTEIVK